MGLFGPDKIMLMLERYNFRPGEVIKGTVRINLKKPTNARKLEVGLFGERKERTRGHDGKTTIRTVNIFNFKIPLGAEGVYQTGDYPFEIPIPGNVLSIDTRQNIDGKLGAAVDALSILSGQRIYPVEWFVKSQLDVPMMFDVKKEQKIIIIS